jgi:hypothetical protein
MGPPQTPNSLLGKRLATGGMGIPAPSSKRALLSGASTPLRDQMRLNADEADFAWEGTRTNEESSIMTDKEKKRLEKQQAL